LDFNSTEALVAEVPAVAGDSAARRPRLTIRAASGWVALDLWELWQFRDLMFALSIRDIKLRYKQTALGAIWVVLQPLMAAGILTFVFGTVARVKTGPVPIFVFEYTMTAAWGLFNNVLSKAGGSLVGNTNLISKVFFPRLILPLSALPSSLLDFSISLVVLGGLLAYHHIVPGWGMLLMPLWLILLLAYAIGIGLVVTSLMVSYRDVAYMLPLATQILFYACPIVYPVSSLSNVSAKALFWYNLNPLASVFEAIAWSVFGTGALDWGRLLVAISVGVVTLMIGVYAFKNMERKFADVI